MAEARHQAIASKLVKEIARLGGDVTQVRDAVPLLVLGVVFVVLWLLASYWVLDRYRITATVVQIDAPAECWERKSGFSRLLKKSAVWNGFPCGDCRP
jgi:hypothetical protein